MGLFAPSPLAFFVAFSLLSRALLARPFTLFRACLLSRRLSSPLVSLHSLPIARSFFSLVSPLSSLAVPLASLFSRRALLIRLRANCRP